MDGTKVSLKLLINKKSRQVLYAEADKKFVDFLFSIFTLPVETIARLLQKQNMAGCLHNLHNSIEILSLRDICIQLSQGKDFVLNPKVAISGTQVPLLLPSIEQSNTVNKFYRCGSHYSYVTIDRRAICPSCKCSMTTEVSYVNPPSDIKASSSSEGGYAKELITYMVTNDLYVKPISMPFNLTPISLHTKSDATNYEEKVVDFGMDEGVRLLVASFQSKTVLTDVFMSKDHNHTINEE